MNTHLEAYSAVPLKRTYRHPDHHDKTEKIGVPLRVGQGHRHIADTLQPCNRMLALSFHHSSHVSGNPKTTVHGSCHVISRVFYRPATRNTPKTGHLHTHPRSNSKGHGVYRHPVFRKKAEKKKKSVPATSQNRLSCTKTKKCRSQQPSISHHRPRSLVQPSWLHNPYLAPRPSLPLGLRHPIDA